MGRFDPREHRSVPMQLRCVGGVAFGSAGMAVLAAAAERPCELLSPLCRMASERQIGAREAHLCKWCRGPTWTTRTSVDATRVEDLPEIRQHHDW